MGYPISYGIVLHDLYYMKLRTTKIRTPFWTTKVLWPPEDQDFIPKLSYKGEEIGRVSTTLVDVYEEGKDKVAQNFGRKLFNTSHSTSQP